MHEACHFCAVLCRASHFASHVRCLILAQHAHATPCNSRLLWLINACSSAVARCPPLCSVMTTPPSAAQPSQPPLPLPTANHGPLPNAHGIGFAAHAVKLHSGLMTQF